LEAEISISYKTVQEAEAVARAVSPDNLVVPSGLFVKTMRRGSRVMTKIACEGKLETFMATVDDLLSAVSVAERTLSALKNR
jgi:hypothetical protein